MATDIINIGGIVRNTTKMNAQKGDMEEIINLRRKDGLLKPIPRNNKIWSDGKFSDYSQLIVHTGKTYKHLLGISIQNNKNIYYIGNIEAGSIDGGTFRALDEPINVGIKVVRDEVSVHQVGNLMCLSDGTEVHYLLWKDGKYNNVSIDYNGEEFDDLLSPDGKIELRVKPHTNQYGIPTIFATHAGNESSSEENKEANIASMIAQVKRVAKEQGVLHGFIVAVTALELYDGSYTLAGRPILLSQPNDDGTRYTSMKGWQKDHLDENNTIEEIQDTSDGEQLKEVFHYQKNVKGLDVVRDEFGFNDEKAFQVSDKIIKDSNGTEKIIPLRYGTRRYCNHQMGFTGDDGNTPYSTIDLFNSKEKDGDVLIPKSYPLMCYDTTDNGAGTCHNDAFDFASQDWTIRGSSITEHFDTKKGGRGEDEPARSYGCDSWNAPNEFAVVSLDDGGRDLMEQFWSYGDKKDSDYKVHGVFFGNDLQVRFNYQENEALSNIIKNICVFISSEVYQTKPDGKVGVRDILHLRRTGSSHRARELIMGGYSGHILGRDDKDIKKEIEEIGLFYKVYDTPYKGAPQNKWIDIPLKDKLNVLEEQIRLDIDSSFQRSGYKSECSYLYNGRLHLGNLTKTMFKGYPLSYFEIPEQWEMKVKTDYSHCRRVSKSEDNKKSLFEANSPFIGYYIENGNNRAFVMISDEGDVLISGNMPYTVHTEVSVNLNGVKVVCEEQSDGTYSYDDNGNVVRSSRPTKGADGSYIVMFGSTKADVRFYVDTLEYEEGDKENIIETSNVVNSFSYGAFFDVMGEVSLYGGNVADRYIKSRKNVDYDVCKQWVREQTTIDGNVFVIVKVETNDGNRYACRQTNKGTYYSLNPMLSYPDSRATEMIIGYKEGDIYNSVRYELKRFNAIESAIYISSDLRPIRWWEKVKEDSELKDFFDENGMFNKVSDDEYMPNTIKVSATETPMHFPAINTYQVGNGEVLGMCANTMALSTGQWGDAPLYVFCSDGVYGLFVDSSGQLVYPNSRPINREVCNNDLSITPIDGAVVFTSDRGCFMLSGSEMNEISKQAEGRVLDYANKGDKGDYLRPMDIVMNDVHWLEIPEAPTGEEFKEYLKKCRIGWNYKDRELWVAHRDKDYVYIFSEGVWSKAMRKIKYFINDYPNTYYVDNNNEVYDISSHTEDSTDCFFLTRPIVIDGETPKNYLRAWLYADLCVTQRTTDIQVEPKYHKASIFVYGSQDGNKYKLIGIGGVKGDYQIRNILANIHRMSVRYIRIAFAGHLGHESRIECLGLEYKTAWGAESAIKPR